MTIPRHRVVVDMFLLAMKHGCTDAELQAAVDAVKRNPKGRPKSKIYEPFTGGMFALVGIYRRDRFTAAKQILSLAGRPVDQRENQARALVRRFDESFWKEELAEAQEFFARCDVDTRVSYFYKCWKRSGLPWPFDIKSASDMETERQTMASKGASDTTIREYVVALDKSIAASSFESGRL